MVAKTSYFKVHFTFYHSVVVVQRQQSSVQKSIKREQRCFFDNPFNRSRCHICRRRRCSSSPILSSITCCCYLFNFKASSWARQEEVSKRTFRQHWLVVNISVSPFSFLLRSFNLLSSCFLFALFFSFSENVTVDDIRRVSSRMLASRPSVAALGNLATLPKYDDIQRAFANRGNFSGASRFFRFN